MATQEQQRRTEANLNAKRGGGGGSKSSGPYHQAPRGLASEFVGPVGADGQNDYDLLALINAPTSNGMPIGRNGADVQDRRDMASQLYDLGAIQRQDEQNKSRVRPTARRTGSGISGMGEASYGIGETQRRDMSNFDQSQGQEDTQFNYNLTQQAAEAEQKRKLAFIQQLLASIGMGSRGGRSVTETGTSNTSGQEYHMVAGRPVAMPTSSTTSTNNTQKTSGMDQQALIQALLGMM